MARPSKLSPAQWAEIERRAAAGENVAALAKEFGVARSTVSERVSGISVKVREVAHKVASAQAALAELPVQQQYAALSLAESLRDISYDMASAARYGAKTAHRLHALANSEVARVDDANPMASLDSLRNVGVLTKLANDSSHIALNLLAANKDAVKSLNDAPPARPTIDPTKLSSRALSELLGARTGD